MATGEHICFGLGPTAQSRGEKQREIDVYAVECLYISPGTDRLIAEFDKNPSSLRPYSTRMPAQVWLQFVSQLVARFILCMFRDRVLIDSLAVYMAAEGGLEGLLHER